jgi:ribA/ribD-fused uncharacterized protein
METDNYVFFYGHTPNKLGIHIFSQWFPATFSENLDGVITEYKNTEQYMMAGKARLFRDDYHLNEILQESDPSKIKDFGQKIRNFDANTWDQDKFDIVVQGNRLKFNQNPKLMERLLQTGSKILVEASPYDKIWGIGLNPHQAVKVDPSQWQGENLLGKALMVVRSEKQ